jgi:hypothetical protein
MYECWSFQHAVDEQRPAAHVQRVARHPDDPLDEHRRDVGRCDSDRRILRRRNEHDNIAALRFGVPRKIAMRKGDVWTVPQLVHVEPVAFQ